MTLSEFAQAAGVRITRCDPGWGGTWAYELIDYPNCKYCGYRSAHACYRAWLSDTFGATTAKAIMDLLRRAK